VNEKNRNGNGNGNGNDSDNRDKALPVYSCFGTCLVEAFGLLRLHEGGKDLKAGKLILPHKSRSEFLGVVVMLPCMNSYWVYQIDPKCDNRVCRSILDSD